MKNNDWHEAYFDLVNKVECECVQQGDLVPIWDQFKAISAERAQLRAELEAAREVIAEQLEIRQRNEAERAQTLGGNHEG